MDPENFSYYSDHADGDAFQNLSKSDYAKVIFCDLYYNLDSTVGCRFQITDHVHEDPCDYIGLFRVGYDNLSQCLASKMLSQTECEEDGKSIRCTFKPCELPELENGFYQFLYVTRDNEVCGASMPFQIKNSITKNLSSEDDVVADSSEDDFLVVRSNMAEKNRHLQALLDDMTEKCLNLEREMRKVQLNFKIIYEDKLKLEQLLKKACEEKMNLYKQNQIIAEEKNVECSEKEEAIRILKEKNKVFSSMFDDYSDKLKEFAKLKDALEADKDLAIAENVKLQDQIKKLTENFQIEQNVLEHEKEKNQELAVIMKRETSALTSQLDDARLKIEALEKSKQLSIDDLTSLTAKVDKLQEKLKDVKCENLVLKTRLSETVLAYEKMKQEKEGMMSELAALKLHVIEMHVTKRRMSSVSDTKEQQACISSKSYAKEGQHSQFQEESIQTDQTNGELQILKKICNELRSKVGEKDAVIAKLNEELVKANGVVEYLTKERDSVQKNDSMKQQALDECILRLNEASELYKKQFRKIEKLKKKLNKSDVDMDKSSSTSMSVKDSCSLAEFADQATPSPVQLPQNQNSDSDTGEHVLRHPINVEKKDCYVVHVAKDSLSQASSLSAAAKSKPSSPKLKEVPELQTLIEMNLEKLKNSKSKEEDEILYSIPCPVCDQDIGVYMSSTDEMVKHLEMQHKQKVCPVCGRLFDMNLPPKYFLFHVEDHFVKGKQK